MTVRAPRKKSKNPPYFSHDFVINNHGDIVSFVAMIFTMGLMHKKTHEFSSMFLFVHHNSTDEDATAVYSAGKKDACMVFFYTLVCIVMHAVLQEYVIDKYTKKLNLTKARFAKFCESVFLALFFTFSVFWGVHSVLTDNMLPALNSLWEGYPHQALSLWTKLFFIVQICYWLHDYPELYFQRVKQELILSRVLQSTLYLIGISLAYAGGLSKLCILLLLIHYSADIFFHTARAFHLTEYTKVASMCFTVWNVLFIPTRMVCTILVFLALHYGLGKQSIDFIDFETGNFNTSRIRFMAMAFFFLTQAFMVWNFITFHQRRRHGRPHSVSGGKSFGQSADLISQKRKEKKRSKREEEDTTSDVADSDQSNHHRDVHRRKPVRS